MDSWELQIEQAKKEASEVRERARRALLVFGGVILVCAVLAGLTWALRSVFPFH